MSKLEVSLSVPRKVYRKRLERIQFSCPNCQRELSRTLWAEATEFDCETGKPTPDGYDLIHTEAKCKCGAELAVVDDMEDLVCLWLNRTKMEGKKV